MIDGLALGETTPGPLIMVVAFVALSAAGPKRCSGQTSCFRGGAGGRAGDLVHFSAVVCFYSGWRAAGGVHPRQDTFHRAAGGHHGGGGGVIASLALFFITHVAWPDGLTAGWRSPVAWPALLIMLVAGVALLRYKVGVIPEIAASALAGLLMRWTGLA